jgi:hypothetical protein
MRSGFKQGDIVEIRSLNEILNTLDDNGTIDGLPFMPEMIKFCEKQFTIFQRVTQSVMDTAGLSDYNEAHVRTFRDMNVYVLKNIRCSGESHNGCQRGCTLFWKEAWLKKVDSLKGNDKIIDNHITNELKVDLKIKDDSGKYFCQSTQFFNATKNISKGQRFLNLPINVWLGNYGIIMLIRILSIWGFWKIYNKFFGTYPKGNSKKTPEEILNLQPGEIVEVKSLKEIINTLNNKGCNRGLHFSPDMIKHCGKQFKVRNRAEKIILEATGEMLSFTNTVVLEDAYTDSAYYAFGGCPREDFAYWREIWLKRINV